MTSGAHSHPEYVTRAEYDDLLLRVGQIGAEVHSHVPPPEPEPDPNETVFDSADYPSWQATFDAASAWAGPKRVLLTTHETRADAIRVERLADCVIQPILTPTTHSHSTNPEGSALRFLYPRKVTLLPGIELSGSAPDTRSVDAQGVEQVHLEQIDLSDACGIKVDGGEDFEASGYLVHHVHCAGVWVTCDDPETEIARSVTIHDGLVRHSHRDGHHASHGWYDVHFDRTVSEYCGDDGVSFTGEGLGGTLGRASGTVSRYQSAGSGVTVEGVTDVEIDDPVIDLDRETAAAIRVMTASSFGTGPTLGVTVRRPKIHETIRHTSPHRTMHISADLLPDGRGRIDGVRIEQPEITRDAGTQELVAIQEWYPAESPITGVAIEGLAYTAPSGVGVLNVVGNPEYTLTLREEAGQAPS